MSRILGLDLGTSSIGWAVREENKILYSGVLVFPMGVGEEKGVEYSLASERTKHRASRKIYRRRKWRKVDLLRVLISENMCPLTEEELNTWAVYEKGKTLKYPTENQDFTDWLYLNPYEIRAKAVHKPISKKELGRALYHICQRRGFKSGRKDADAGKDLEVYQVEKKKMQELGCKTLGEYQYQLLEASEKVRKTKYEADDNKVNSSRITYVEEFKEIIKTQKIDEQLSKKLFKAIFHQRPLKSQKGTIGKCTLEKDKSRCAISHPLYEEFRMYQFLNSIKIKNKYSSQDKAEFLSKNIIYFNIAKKLFFRKKANFKFVDISKAINKAAKKQNAFFEFNYNDKYPVVGCPTISEFVRVFGAENWEDCKENIKKSYKRSDTKKAEELVDELWHTLFFAGDFVNDITTTKIKEFIRERFDIEEKKVEVYEKISLKQGYASLSKKAIKNILPFLKEHIIYSYAVFFANIVNIIGKERWEKDEEFIKDTIIDIIDSYRNENLKIDIVNGLVGDFIKDYDNADFDYVLDETDKKDVLKKIISFLGVIKWNDLSENDQKNYQEEIENTYLIQLQKRRVGGYYLAKPRLDEKIKQFLIAEYQVTEAQSKKLYHPSAMEVYPESTTGKLESPYTASVRNPMAMRTLYQLKKLINTLLDENKIDADTKVIIELARELNDKNKRLAIERYQREREAENKKYSAILEEYATKVNATVTDVDVVKYRLREEQKGICLYTNKKIGIEDLFGAIPKFDIEHTFPRSKSFDNSLENKTLADKNLNQLKGNRIPQELEYKYVENAINNSKHWLESIKSLKEKIEQQKYFSKIATTVEQKNKAIQQKHYLLLHYKYWNGKYNRFLAKEIPNKFKNSQLVDTGIITKYAKLYLQTLFKNVFPAKGTMVADVRKSWGLPEKDRKLHYHHAVDAIVLTCMTKDIREKLTSSFLQAEKLQKRQKFIVQKPWKRFTEDVLEIQNNILVVHKHPDNLLTQTKIKLRERGKVQYDKNGNTIFKQGKGIRNSLHKDTFYGAIERVNDKYEKELWYVIRKPVNNSFKETDVKNIVDEGIKQRIFKHGLKNIRTGKGFILLPAEEGKKEMLIKRIRVKTNFKQLPKIKKQSHKSETNKKPYKEHYYAVLENLFSMVVYEAENNKGKIIKGFQIISAFDVSKNSIGKNKLEIPVESNIVKNKGKKSEVLLPLSFVLKVNQLVLFYDKGKEELKRLKPKDLSNRLYKITQFENDGRIQLKHHCQGGPDNELKKESSLDFNRPAQKLRISLSNFKAAQENLDFKISSSGKIDFLY